MIGKKAFTALLILAAFVASIYAPIKILPIKFSARTSTSPFNTGWNGTSEFYNTLISEGYDVYTLNSMDDLDHLIATNDTVLYLVIAPDIPFSFTDVDKLLSILNRASHVSFLIADENVTSNALLSRLFHSSISGLILRDPKSPYGLEHPIVECELNGTVYTLVLNVASYILLHSSREQTKVLCKYDDKPIVAYFELEKYHGIVVSDSSIFINQFFEEEYLNKSIPKRYTPIDNSRFALALVRLLTHNSTNYKIIIDCAHYKTIDLNSLIGLPIPPIGLILSLFLVAIIRFLDALYLTFLEYLTVIMRILALFIVTFFVYSILKRAGGRVGFDEGIYRHRETKVIYEVELPGRRVYDIKYLSKKDAIELLASLYTILCRVALRELKIDLSRIDEPPVQERFRLIFKDKSDKALKTILTLRKVYEYHSGKRRFIWPPILFWKRTLSKLILNSEMILEVMGATIVGKPGVKGVEYRLRKV